MSDKSSSKSSSTDSGQTSSEHISIPKQVIDQFCKHSIRIGKLIRKGEYGAVFEGQFDNDFRAEPFFTATKAKVFKKAEPKNGTKFAVKFVDIGSREKLGVSGVTNGIKSEVQVLQTVKCEGVVHMWFALQLTQPDQWFVFLELADGNLQMHLHRVRKEKRKLSFRITKHWIRTLCQTLQYLHEQGISHNRLRSSNVLLFVRNAQTEQIDVKIADFVSVFFQNSKELEKYSEEERQWMFTDRLLEDLCDFWLLSTDLLIDTAFSSRAEATQAVAAIDRLIHSEGSTVDLFRTLLQSQTFIQ